MAQERGCSIHDHRPPSHAPAQRAIAQRFCALALRRHRKIADRLPFSVEERSCGGRRHARPKADRGSILGRLFDDRGLSCTYRQEQALRRGSVGTNSLLKLPLSFGATAIPLTCSTRSGWLPCQDGWFRRIAASGPSIWPRQRRSARLCEFGSPRRTSSPMRSRSR